MNRFIFAILMSLESLSFGKALQIGDHSFKSIEMAPYLSYFCTLDQMDISQVKKSPLFKEGLTPLHFSYMLDHECWSKLTITNTSEQDQYLYLEHQQTLTAELKLYEDDKPPQEIGYERNFASRAVKSAKPTFKVKFPPGEKTLYFSQKSKDQMWLHFKAWSSESFYQAQAFSNIINGGFIALAFGLALYNLLQFSISTKQSLFFYVSYLIFVAIGHMFLSGYLKQFIWHDHNYFSNHFGLLSIQLAFLSAYGFIYTFLDLKEKLPILSKGLYIFVAFAFVAMSTNIAGYYSITGALNLGILICGSLYMVVVSLILAIRGEREATFFSISWSFMFAGVVIVSLLYVGVLPAHPLIANANIIGTSLQTILLSFAIADQIKQKQTKMKEDREHALSQLEKMVYPHQIQEIKEGGILEQTMPCESSEAIVLCFDIVNSTKLNPDWSKEFISEVLDSCQKLMEQDLNSKRPQLNAYRIKEMGDGFLCSIGFPFKLPPGTNQANLAIDLAMEFVNVFEKVAKTYPHMNNLLCSIGIAKDQIEGFFTVSEPRHYEMFGRGSVLATRYEGVRKNFAISKHKHLITLQEGVFDDLDADRAKVFRMYNLHRDVIRDDLSAKRFYYLNIKARNRNMIGQEKRDFKSAMPSHGKFTKNEAAS